MTMTAIKERPILYSAPMVLAKLAGVKTQTRRLVKPQPDAKISESFYPDRYNKGRQWNFWNKKNICGPEVGKNGLCPYGDVGDRLYGKEMHRYHGFTEDGEPHIEYFADLSTRLCKVPSESQDRVQDIWAELSEPASFGVFNRACDVRWRPSIHMPRWASRILDEIVEIRVERVQDISEADVIAEGVETLDIKAFGWNSPSGGYGPVDAALSPRSKYQLLWDSINGLGSWESNPWVWVIVTKPINAIAAYLLAPEKL